MFDMEHQTNQLILEMFDKLKELMETPSMYLELSQEQEKEKEKTKIVETAL